MLYRGNIESQTENLIGAIFDNNGKIDDVKNAIAKASKDALNCSVKGNSLWEDKDSRFFSEQTTR